MAAWIWVLIPLAAILVGGFKEWLEFKSRQEKLGTSTHELEEHTRTLREALERSEAEREKLTGRVQNLETIVTSQAWDALPEGPTPGALGDGQRSSEGAESHAEPGDAEKAERLAQRLKV